MHTYIHAYKHTCIHYYYYYNNNNVCMYVCTHVCMYVCMFIYIYCHKFSAVCSDHRSPAGRYQRPRERLFTGGQPVVRGFCGHCLVARAAIVVAGHSHVACINTGVTPACAVSHIITEATQFPR